MFTRRRLLVIGVVVLSSTYVLAVGLPLPTSNPADGDTPSRGQMVQPVDNGSYLWPYTAREETTQQRTLATNLVIVGEDERVQRALTEQTNLNWELTEPTENESENETAVNETVTPTPEGTETPAAGNDTADNGTEEFAAPTPVPEENASVNDSVPQPVAVDESVINWNDAHGSTRYSYIDARPAGGEAGWVDEAYQIHAGAYFGSRYHIRAYTTPEAEWTAIQIHQEYWDWFRLRHTVTDIQRSRNVLESDFLDQPYVRSVSREYYGINRGWNDGWLSEIRLAPGLAAVFLLALFTRETHKSIQQEGRRLFSWTRNNIRGFVMAGVLAAVYLGVRSVGIVLETTVPNVDPRVFLAVLYPTIALGLPLLAVILAQPFGATSRFDRTQRIADRLGPPIEALPAFGFAVAGLGGAFVLDFAGLGVGAIPVQLILHRVGLACALGLLAAGSTRVDERGAGLLVLGALGWLVGLVMPLFGYI